MTTHPKKNTVASLLAQVRGDNSLSSLHPELTIEPIYKSGNGAASSEDGFDTSSGGRRLSTYIDSEGRLGIKNVSESPEIRNLSERGDSEEMRSDAEGSNEGGRDTTPQRTMTWKCGWSWELLELGEQQNRKSLC